MAKMKLSVADAVSKLHVLSQNLFDNYNIPCQLNADFPIYMGGTHINKDRKVDCVVIGIGDIYYANSSFRYWFTGYIPDVNFVASVLTIQHEYAHCVQNFEYCQQKLSVQTKQQLFHEIACVDNPLYYKTCYWTDPSEIQAEYYALQQTYSYMCSEFPTISSKYHEKLILSVFNEKMLSGDYFIKNDKPFVSLDEVYQVFEQTYDKAAQTILDYNIFNEGNHDFAADFIRFHPDIKFSDRQTQGETDKFLTDINLQYHPEYIKLYPGLNLSDKVSNRGYEFEDLIENSDDFSL